MTKQMPASESQTVQTRASPGHGLKVGDEDRWHEFHRLYGPVIRGFALKAGLNETEADEVVQETCIGLAKNVGEFHYDPAKCGPSQKFHTQRPIQNTPTNPTVRATRPSSVDDEPQYF